MKPSVHHGPDHLSEQDAPPCAWVVLWKRLAHSYRVSDIVGKPAKKVTTVTKKTVVKTVTKANKTVARKIKTASKTMSKKAQTAKKRTVTKTPRKA